MHLIFRRFSCLHVLLYLFSPTRTIQMVNSYLHAHSTRDSAALHPQSPPFLPLGLVSQPASALSAYISCFTGPCRTGIAGISSAHSTHTHTGCVSWYFNNFLLKMDTIQFRLLPPFCWCLLPRDSRPSRRILETNGRLLRQLAAIAEQLSLMRSPVLENRGRRRDTHFCWPPISRGFSYESTAEQQPAHVRSIVH